MNYVKNDFVGYKFPRDYVQCFQNKFIANAAMEKEIVRKKMNGELTDSDVNMCAFVYEHTVATIDMLMTIAQVAPDNKDEFVKHLDRLVLYRVMNRFILCTDDKNREFPADAMVFYTLDMGGKYLLEHYWSSTVDLWNTGTAGLCAEKVSRLLVAAAFRVKLMESCPNKLKEFKCRSYRIGRDVANLSFEFRLEVPQKDGSVAKRYFVGDVVRESDEEVDFRDRVEMLNSICSTRIWQRIWPLSENPPIVLFVVEDESKVENLIRTLQMYKIPKFYVTTDERLSQGLNRTSGVWQKFDEVNYVIEEVKTKMFMD